MNEWIAEIKRLVMESLGIARALLIEEYKGQGHVATSRLINNMNTRLIEEGNTIIGELLVNDYARYLEVRTPGSRIPYSRGSGAARSKYIEGLRSWWMTKGLNEREALGAAFAVATIHKRDGRPSPRSYAFSTNGRRTGAIEEAFKLENLTPINEILLSEKLIGIFQRGVVEGLAQAA